MVASVIVLIELGIFQILYLLGINYLVATVLSMIIGIILNWIVSHAFVFKSSKYSKKIEFGLIVMASIVGIAIQTITTFIAVEMFTVTPIIGKLFAVGITFFWNYFFRARFVFTK
jgi:putative flippase GtrA